MREGILHQRVSSKARIRKRMINPINLLNLSVSSPQRRCRLFGGSLPFAGRFGKAMIWATDDCSVCGQTFLFFFSKGTTLLFGFSFDRGEWGSFWKPLYFIIDYPEDIEKDCRGLSCTLSTNMPVKRAAKTLTIFLPLTSHIILPSGWPRNESQTLKVLYLLLCNSNNTGYIINWHSQ